jgi:hypothetical protein
MGAIAALELQINLRHIVVVRARGTTNLIECLPHR